jgi:non-ribosomal peptide synthetase component E (peptide arylation enzyme)
VVRWTDVRVVGEDGCDLPPGEIGEILVRGPGQCIGVLAGDTIVPVSEDGWLHTDDLGELDVRGRLTVRGRLKDVIIRAGEKISCGEVEEVLLEHRDVVDTAVVGLDHRLMGQQVAAFIVARPGSSPNLKDLARHCLEAGLANHKVPKRLRIVNAIPRSLLGKVQRYQLAEQLTADVGSHQ